VKKYTIKEHKNTNLFYLNACITFVNNFHIASNTICLFVVRKKRGSCSYISSMKNSGLCISGPCETKIVSVFSLLKCEHALVKRQNFQLIRATYAFSMKNNVFTVEIEYADEIFS